MQKGRVYRAAKPRGTSSDMPWNHQAPAWLQMDGFVVWNGVILLMNTGDPVQSNWSPLTVIQAWNGTFSGGGHTFTWHFNQRPFVGAPGLEIRFNIVDYLGRVLNKRWHWKPGDVPWGDVGFPEFCELILYNGSGGFLPLNSVCQPTPVVYALEP